MRTTLLDVSSFMSKVDTSGDCWTWTGTKNGSGYGTFQDGSPKGVGAHRWSYEAFVGTPGATVRHVVCRNPLCVKPTHLKSGTHAQNMQDKFFDESGNTQKLSVEDVKAIRSDFVRYSQRRSNAHELADRYGIHHKYVQRIAEGKALTYVH